MANVTNRDLKKAIEKQGSGLKDHIDSDLAIHLEAKTDRALAQASIEALPTKEETTAMIVAAVKETVNGKVDKANTNIGWMIKIGGAVIMASFLFDGWLSLTTIKQGDALSAVAATLKAIQTTK